MLKLDDVTFAHPGQQKPYQFSLSISPGEVLGISGVSGSGKSTLLELIAGFLTPSSGSICLEDSDLTHLPPEQRPVSILFQDDNLFEHLSVGKNLALGLPRTLPKSERETRITSALEEVGLSGFAARRASTLSGGQKQRAALARTLLRGNPIILLDEPFTALDPGTAADMRQLLAKLTHKENWHVVLVSHDPEDIRVLATHHMQVAGNTLKPVA